MSLENIPSSLFTAGSAGIAGFLIGFALKKIMKLLVVIVGLFFGALMYLQSQAIVAINWDRLQSIWESTLLIINSSINNTQFVTNITANLGIPLAGGLSAGLAIGLMKG